MRRLAVVLLVLGGLLAAPVAASAVEITAFLNGSYPSENWNLGAGVDVTFSFLKIAGWGIEAARQKSPSERAITYVTVHAIVVLPIKKLRLYGGLGAGVFYEDRGLSTTDDTGTLTAFILGAKVRIEDILVLKGEYRRIGLTGTPPLSLDHRWSVGAGIAF